MAAAKKKPLEILIGSTPRQDDVTFDVTIVVSGYDADVKYFVEGLTGLAGDYDVTITGKATERPK